VKEDVQKGKHSHEWYNSHTCFGGVLRHHDGEGTFTRRPRNMSFHTQTLVVVVVLTIVVVPLVVVVIVVIVVVAVIGSGQCAATLFPQSLASVPTSQCVGSSQTLSFAHLQESSDESVGEGVGDSVGDGVGDGVATSLPQSVESVPASQCVGSSQALSLAHLHESSPLLPQSLESVPTTQCVGSSQVLSFAHLHESSPPARGYVHSQIASEDSRVWSHCMV